MQEGGDDRNTSTIFTTKGRISLASCTKQMHIFSHLLICFLEGGAAINGNKTDVFCVYGWSFLATCC